MATPTINPMKSSFQTFPKIDNSVEAQFSQGSVNNENDAYWVAYVQLCYQGDENEDT